ncbi:hypothetical protein RI367_005399 [Sorochytrium milnesiophthora]
MRVKRQKTSKKIMALYKTSFGFYEPYQVVVDGTFTNVALSYSINLPSVLPKTIMGEVRLFTTPCILAELKQLGEAFGPTIGANRRFELRKCGHPRGLSAAECLTQLIGSTNEQRLVIATQDTKLRSTFRNIPGVPLLYLSNSVLVIEPHSAATLDYVARHEQGKTLVPASEKKQLKVLKSRDAPATTTTTPTVPSGKMPARKKVKGPNPLSVKKRKRTDDEERSAKRPKAEQAAPESFNADATAVPTTEQHKKRRRQKKKRNQL